MRAVSSDHLPDHMRLSNFSSTFQGWQIFIHIINTLFNTIVSRCIHALQIDIFTYPDSYFGQWRLLITVLDHNGLQLWQTGAQQTVRNCKEDGVSCPELQQGQTEAQSTTTEMH